MLHVCWASETTDLRIAAMCGHGQWLESKYGASDIHCIIILWLLYQSPEPPTHNASLRNWKLEVGGWSSKLARSCPICNPRAYGEGDGGGAAAVVLPRPGGGGRKSGMYV